MTVFLTNILLALAWAALTGDITLFNLVIGMLVGFVLLWLTRRLMPESKYFQKIPQVIAFVLFFIWELIKANFRMAWIVVDPKRSVRPAVVAVPLDADSDAEITLLANLITLTPGTLFLDVSEDRKVMYVHTMHIQDLDDFRRTIKDGLEHRVLEVFR